MAMVTFSGGPVYSQDLARPCCCIIEPMGRESQGETKFCTVETLVTATSIH